MRNFSFYNPSKIHFGEGQIAKLSKEFSAGSRVLVTHGGGSIFSNGVWAQVEHALQGVGELCFDRRWRQCVG